MVDILEVKGWSGLKGVFVVDVRSVEDLKKIAEGLNVPCIFHKKKEYVFFCGQLGPAPVVYRFKA